MDGLGQYDWIAARLGDVSLEAMPPWLMVIVNGPAPRTRSSTRSTAVATPTTRAPDGMQTSKDDAHEPLAGELAAVTSLLRTASKTFPNAGPNGDDSSTYSRSKRISAYIVSHHY